MIIKYTTKKGKTTELNGVPEKETEKAMLITFTSNKSTIEKWLPKSQLKEIEEGVWEMPSWLGGPINYDLIVANNPNKSWKPRSWEKN